MTKRLLVLAATIASAILLVVATHLPATPQASEGSAFSELAVTAPLLIISAGLRP